ncbi:hypothetical protein AVEN_205086-1 [Araneus ventricosus]|uniref:Uncharacterized protein n=1 Tax=Araneus ventricosus TaxID=182803 RepID=A0A4Y2H2S3_ARAVE|nr:hypothetical protein AVEN_205086-1 [Araneus ventricosus]
MRKMYFTCIKNFEAESIIDFEKRYIEVTGLGLKDLGFQLPLSIIQGSARASDCYASLFDMVTATLSINDKFSTKWSSLSNGCFFTNQSLTTLLPVLLYLRFSLLLPISLCSFSQSQRSKSLIIEVG